MSSLSLAKSSLAYAKLTATPTETAWSQIYNAGNLFACLSLSLPEPSEEIQLPTIGKELLNTLEAEFFTLEEKNSTTITEVIEKSTKDLPEQITANFCVAFVKDAILYLFLQGRGRVIMKRGEKHGVLLEQPEESSQKIYTASGYLHNGDTIILESNQFANNMLDNHITEALQLDIPNDIAESLSIHMHKHADGDQAAIIIKYQGISPILHAEKKEEQTLADAAHEDEEVQQTMKQTIATETDSFDEPPSSPYLQSLVHKGASLFTTIPFLKYKRSFGHLDHRKKLFVSIGVILVILLIVSIFFTKQQQEKTQKAEQFAAIYDPALKKYDEGHSLMALNPTTSREDLLEAEKLLQEGQKSFPEGSPEAKQIAELLLKVQQALNTEAQKNVIAISEISVDENSPLALANKITTGKGFSHNDDAVYYVTNDEAVSVSSSGDQTTLVTNDNDWEKALTIVPYLTNFYILDQQDGILKFVPAGDSYNKSAYLTSSPDLSSAIDIAIDSSIWILFSDGTIKKYTRGAEDSFSIKDLTTPLNQPTRIVTAPDFEHVYILDNGNSRIVKIATDGTFQKEYIADPLKEATLFTVNDSESTIQFLSDGKTWEFSL